jgi:hypothetical protein
MYALLVPPKQTMPSPSCTRQDNKIVPRGIGVSLIGTPMLAEASLSISHADYPSENATNGIKFLVTSRTWVIEWRVILIFCLKRLLGAEKHADHATGLV